MRSAFTLGLRLAVGTGGQRARSLMTLTASALGALLLLLVWAIAHSQVGTTTAFERQEVGLLIAGTIGMVGLPVLVLVATVARLSARVRDRRLSNLRLLGLSASQTRVVAATEVGLASVAGAVIGAAFFVAIVPLVARIDIAGRGWSASSLLPPLLAWVCVLLSVPMVSMVTAAAPQRLASRRALATSRHGDVTSTQLWRVVPLVAGFGLCWSTRSSWVDSGVGVLSPWEIGAILVGILLLGIGILLVVPVFVGLVAALVLRLSNGPLATLVGRRLQTQPTGATRVISALMIGLFIIVAARAVLTAFYSTPQYVHAADFIERDQMAETTVTATEASAAKNKIARIDGVNRVESFPTLHAQAVGSPEGEEEEATILVATCTELAGPGQTLKGCRNGVVNLVGEPWFYAPDLPQVQVQAQKQWQPQGEPVLLSTQGAATIDLESFDRLVGALHSTPALVVPPDTPGIAELLAQTDHVVVAHAGPGRFLYDRMYAAGFSVDTMVDIENYDFVQGMRTLVWVLASVVLSIGLLTFTIAGIDRALGRRRELTALRLIGTPGRLLRTAQWCEAALPTMFGTLLAIAAGGYAGATYLQLDEDKVIPLTAALALAAVAAATSAALAWITTIGTTARLDPEHIRAE